MRGLVLGSIIATISACTEPEPTLLPRTESRPASSAVDEAPELPIDASQRAATAATAASQGYDEAAIVVPPPPPGTTIYRVQLDRPQSSGDELAERLVGMLAVMEIELDPAQAAEWAQQALSSTTPDGSSVAEPRPGVVVHYDPWFDDLSIVHAARLESETEQPLDEIPQATAGAVMDALVDQGLLDPSLPLGEAEISFVRSGVGDPDGEHREWVDEVRFETNVLINGIPVLDAGLRLGITPSQELSSLRITDIDVQTVDPIIIEATEAELRDAFAAHVAGSTSAQLEAVEVVERRPVYVLDPEASSGLVEPRYLIRYSLVTTDGEEAPIHTRAMMALLRLTEGEPRVEITLP